MKIAIVGCGGVGGYLGARFRQAGHDVGFLARGANLAALREKGLSVTSPLGNHETGPARASDDPAVLGAALGAVEAVFLTTKLYDLETVARRAAPLVGAATFVIPVQNGVEAHDIIARSLPGAHVLKGTIYIASFLIGPGTILHKSPFCRLRFAPAVKTDDHAVEHMAVAMNGPGVDVAISPDIEVDLWRKLVLLAPFAAVSCMARATVGRVLGDPALAAQHKAAMAETIAVARAKGVWLPAEIEAATLAQTRQFPADSKPSMLEDMEAGRPLELEYLSGAIVRFGKSLGVPTPVHEEAYRALAPFATGKRG